jgi:hypothetical protein
LGDYDRLPFNEQHLFDLVLRNARYERRGKKFTSDIAINRYDELLPDGKSLFKRSQIEEIGGITGYSGLQEIDCSDFDIVAPKWQNRAVKNVKEIRSVNVSGLVQKGISLIPYETDVEFPDNFVPLLSLFPEEKSFPTDFLKTGRPAEFVLEKEHVPVAIIRNGYYIRIAPDSEIPGNGIIIR